MISLIVPIYNKEHTIEKCINSLLSQTYSNIEILLINDGSTDSSGTVCDKYKETDMRIKVFHKTNGGVSSARNLGLKHAKGEYIQFVDCDDYIEKNMCEVLITNILTTSSDIVICGYKLLSDKCVKEISYQKNVINFESEFPKYFADLYIKGFINPPWNKLYKKENIGHEFIDNLSLGEDLIFNLEYLQGIDKISIISEGLYNYVLESEDSLTSTYRKDSFEIAVFLNNQVNKFCKDNLSKETNYKLISEVFFSNVLSSIQRSVYKKNTKKVQTISRIYKIISSSEVRSVIKNINTDTLEYKIMKILIKLKLPMSIYVFYKIKEKITLLK